MNQVWTPLQLEMVQELYEHVPNTLAAEIINAATGSTFREPAVKHKFYDLKRAPRQRVVVEPVWNERRIAMLRDLYGQGVATRKIAALINAETGSTFSKNAVIGAIGRNGLSKTRVFNPRKPRMQARTRPIASWTPAKPVPAPAPIIKSKRVRLFNLASSDCRWISTCPPGRAHLSRFCGAHALSGESYCVYHAAIVYTPPKQRKAA